MLNQNAVAFHKRSMTARGQGVTFQRITGVAPTATVLSVCVQAIVRKVTRDTTEPRRTGYSAGQPGSLTQEDHEVIVLAADLLAAGFPLPVQKNDRIIIEGLAFNITAVDPYTRQIAGAVELIATGVP